MKKLMTLAAAAIIFAGVATLNAAEPGTGGATGTPALKDGAKNGLANGTKNGLANGAKDGLKKGLKNGLKNGLKKGLKNGKKK